jgi:hypothetical protein
MFTSMQFVPLVPSNMSPTASERSSMRASLAAAAAALTLVAGGYVSTQIGSGAGSSSIEQTAATRPAPLSQRVLTPATLPGFSLLADPATVHGATDWALVERAPSEAGRLRSLGFIAGISEQLQRPGASVTSTVEQFRTQAGARAELAHQYRPGQQTFSVATIPGAHGVSTATHHQIMFTSGSYYYLLSGSGISQKQLSGAANSLYLTVNGCVAPSGRK